MERTSPENRQDKTLQCIQVRRNLKAVPPSSCPVPSVFQWEVFQKEMCNIGSAPSTFASELDPLRLLPTNLQRKDLVRAQGCKCGT